MKKRILVVDDSEIVVAVVRDTLEEAGFDVFAAADAHKADDFIFGEQRPDLIILDVMLPGMSGDQKAARLKRDERTKEIPILLLSSKPEEELCRLMAEAGAEGYIRKPFTDRQMVSQIKETLRENEQC